MCIVISPKYIADACIHNEREAITKFRKPLKAINYNYTRTETETWQLQFLPIKSKDLLKSCPPYKKIL